MDKKDVIYRYQPLWGNWNIDRLVGEGKYGKVYRVFSELFEEKYYSAVKVITIPHDDFSATAVRGEENENHEVAVKKIVDEIKILYTLKGNSNIVSYEDHLVIKRDIENVWDIIIRMEYLTPLSTYLLDNTLTMRKIINLAMDMCTALELCMGCGILHGDIKEDNIFITEKDVFKLGDFGVARDLSKANQATAGTPIFMAPEVFRGEKYDITSDIYSLGIVLYKILNNGNLPFVYQKSNVTEEDIEKAFYKRISGEKFEPPFYNSVYLTNIILKMCSYDRSDRYQTPTELKKDFSQLFSVMDDEELGEKLYLNLENQNFVEFGRQCSEDNLCQSVDNPFIKESAGAFIYFLPVILGVVIFIIIKILG